MALMLRRGSQGSDVQVLQKALNQLFPLDYPQLVLDGKFGPNTFAWVQKFQQRNALKVDGIVGPNTWGKLRAKLPMSFPQPSGVGAGVGAGAQPATLPKPKVPTNFYLHSHDVPGKGITMPMHSSGKVHHLVYNREVGSKYNGNIFDATIGHINDNNYSLKKFILNAHGFGAGTVSFGGRTIHLRNRASDFARLRPHFTNDSGIWIYSCLFGNDKVFLDKDGDSNDFDAEFWDGRDVVKSGPGIDALKSIAKSAGVPVRAGFSLQSGNSGKFVGHYVKVNSHGAFAVFNDAANSKPLTGYVQGLINKMYGALFG